jgi:hypothetical protein
MDGIGILKQKLNLVDNLKLTLFILWLTSSLFLGIGLVGNNIPVQISGAVLGTAYVLILIWWLAHCRPQATDLPDIQPKGQLHSRYRVMLGLVTIVSLLLVTIACFLLRDGWLMLILSIPLSMVIIIVGRLCINRRLVIVSLITMAILGLVEQLLGHEMSSGLVVPIGAALLFLAGALLLDYAQLTHIRLLDGDYLIAGKSFLWGCVLAVPPALLNASTMQLFSPSEFDLLFDRWWEPLYALQPGILEEIWARLFLTTLLYASLRPATKARPQRALTWAMLIAAFIHGMAHYPGSIANPLEGLYITLMYGIPLA